MTYLSFMKLERQYQTIQRELDSVQESIRVLLPRYITLINQKELDEFEVLELSEIEHLLIEINGRIAEMKHTLEHGVFGEGLHAYFSTKNKALQGDSIAEKKYSHLRKIFEQTLKDGNLIELN